MSKRDVKIKIEKVVKKLKDLKEQFECLKWIVSMSYPNYEHEESVKVYEEHLEKASLLRKEIDEYTKDLDLYKKILNFYERRK